MNHNNYVVKVVTKTPKRAMYISTSTTTLSPKRKEAMLFASEGECIEAVTQPCFESALSFEFIPVPARVGV